MCVYVFLLKLLIQCLLHVYTSVDDVELLQQIIWRHNVLTEEVEGRKQCVISMHNLVHLTDDIMRFSSPDNFWCYTFERAVHKYVEKSSNKKNLELTFAKAECRRELLKTLEKSVTVIHQHNSTHSACSLKASGLDIAIL